MLIKSLAYFSMIFSLLACAIVSEPLEPEQPQIAEIINIQDDAKFPIIAANFYRGKALTVYPSMDNVSVDYIYESPEQSILSTFYLRPMKGLFKNQLQLEMLKYLEQRQQSVLLHARDIHVQKSGVTFPAHEAVFKFQGQFMNRYQSLFGHLIMWRYKNQLVIVDSVTPYDRYPGCRDKVMQLINNVDWRH